MTTEQKFRPIFDITDKHFIMQHKKCCFSCTEKQRFLFCIRGVHNMKKDNPLQKMVLAALFLALAFVLPFLTGQIPQIGSALCPMHIPVLLCGFLCGWPWGLAVGLIAPFLRSLTLGMPPLFPTAVCMAFELATYGATAGLCRRILPKNVPFVYLSLLISMLSGRLIWGVAMFVCMSSSGGTFGLAAFVAGAFTNAIPGIIIQIILIPILVLALEKVAARTQKN